jgi:hypothetical protein
MFSMIDFPFSQLNDFTIDKIDAVVFKPFLSFFSVFFISEDIPLVEKG